MTDYIDRQAAIDALNKIKIYRPLNSDRYVISDCLNKIVNLPNVEVEPVKHGRWTKIGHIENTWLVSKCSECGYQTIDAGNYCPSCGAKMDAEEGEKE